MSAGSGATVSSRCNVEENVGGESRNVAADEPLFEETRPCLGNWFVRLGLCEGLWGWIAEQLWLMSGLMCRGLVQGSGTWNHGHRVEQVPTCGRCASSLEHARDRQRQVSKQPTEACRRRGLNRRLPGHSCANDLMIDEV